MCCSRSCSIRCWPPRRGSSPWPTWPATSTTSSCSRHPHVFGDVEANTPEDVNRNWEQIKRKEKGRASIMDDVPRNLPALLYAHKIQSKAASAGFDWEGAEGALPKIGEELGELAEAIAADGPGLPEEAMAPRDEGAVRDELGDLLFAVVNVARHLKVDPEAALARGDGQVPPAVYGRGGAGG